jgi:hypothetical protein
MKTGDASHPIPPVIPAQVREASVFSERGSASRRGGELNSDCGDAGTLGFSKVAAGRRPALPWWGLGIFILALAAGWVFYHYNPSQYSFYPRCLLYAATGRLCPGCGSQRALYQLVHGHFLTACRCNLLLMLTLAWLAFKGALHVMANRRGTTPPQWLPQSRWYKWLAVAVILFTVLRNFPGAPFCYLAPP